MGRNIFDRNTKQESNSNYTNSAWSGNGVVSPVNVNNPARLKNQIFSEFYTQGQAVYPGRQLPSQIEFPKPKPEVNNNYGFDSEKVRSNLSIARSTTPQSFAATPKRSFGGISDASKLDEKFYNGTPKTSKPKAKKTKNILVAVAKYTVVLVVGISLLIGGFVFRSQILNSPYSEVAGASEILYPRPDDYGAYVEWAKAYDDIEYYEDADGDSLTNYEEYVLGSNPNSAYSCGEEAASDAENIVDMINPGTCEVIDVNNSEESEKISKIIKISQAYQVSNLSVEFSSQENPQPKTHTVLELFGVSNYDQLDEFTKDNLEQKTSVLEKKQEYLASIDKIERYIKKYRSYDSFDRNYQPPVHPAYYLEVAIEYDVPLKYMLAIARAESRFGTDKFDSAGNLTRPGRYENIYSMGLDDSGNNLSFGSWEGSVVAFGKWYKKYEDRGVADCQKWRIYNPNGDYCEKIETLSSQIQNFLDS